MDYHTQCDGYLKYFRTLCQDRDSRWIKRKRVFDTYSMIQSLIDLSVGNESSYLNVLSRFPGNLTPAASSFWEARSKFSSSLIQEIREDLYDFQSENHERMDWFGFSPYAFDGSKLNLPTTLSTDGFHINPGDYFSTGLLSGLVRITDRAIASLELSSDQNERTAAHRMLDLLTDRDLVVYDRGYLSFSLVTDHIQKG
ncbi:MAG: hypothetical protein EOP04_30995, partial [Proteobacteria bacterium]